MGAADRSYRLQVIVHKHAGTGSVRETFKTTCAPVFHYGGVNCHDEPVEVLETDEAEHAKEFVQGLDLSQIDGICVVGGDGLMQEVVTGLMRRPDREAVANTPVGLVPYGTSNTFANWLHEHPSKTNLSRLARACLPMVLGQTRKVDVMQIHSTADDKIIYGLVTLSDVIFPDQSDDADLCIRNPFQTEFGWGLSGIVAEECQDSSWLRSHRYWYSGFTAITENWTTRPCRATLSYRDLDNTWTELRDVDFRNFLAVKPHELGCDRKVTSDYLSPDNGMMYLSWLTRDKCPSRHELFQLGFNLSKGLVLDKQIGVQTAFVTEFKLQLSNVDTAKLASGVLGTAATSPKMQSSVDVVDFSASESFTGSISGYKFQMGDLGLGYYRDEVQSAVRAAPPPTILVHPVPFSVDGEAMDAKPSVHVRVLPKALTVFAQPASEGVASNTIGTDWR